MWQQLLFGVYQLAIRLYGLAIRIVALRSSKARDWINGRNNPTPYPKKRGDLQPIWFHAASTGEFEQGLPIMEYIRQKTPNQPILLTFFSPSGYHAAQKYSEAFIIEYLPLDTMKKAREFVDKWKPNMAIFIKYEIWPSYLSALHEKKIPSLVVSSRWRPQQLYFRWGRPLFFPLLAKLDHIFVQDALSEEVLKAEGIFGVTRAGDTRIDRVMEVSAEEFDHPLCSAISPEERILILGSSWPADEKILFEAMSERSWPCFDRILIVPHELSEAHLESLADLATLTHCTINQEMPDPKAKIIIVNEMGILAYLYRLADVAYIGGGFGDGIHSILEAAVYGIPVIFGPKHHKFKEAEDLIRIGAAMSVSDKNGLISAVSHFSDSATRKEVKDIQSNYFKKQSGASPKIGQYIIERLKGKK